MSLHNLYSSFLVWRRYKTKKIKNQFSLIEAQEISEKKIVLKISFELCFHNLKLCDNTTSIWQFNVGEYNFIYFSASFSTS